MQSMTFWTTKFQGNWTTACKWCAGTWMGRASRVYAEEGIFVLHKNIRWGLSNCVPVNVLFFSGMFQNPTNNYLSQEAFSEGMFVSIAAFGLDLLVEFLTSESGISPGLDVHCQLAEPNTTRSIAGMPSAFSGMLKKRPINLMKDLVSIRLGQMLLT